MSIISVRKTTTMAPDSAAPVAPAAEPARFAARSANAPPAPSAACRIRARRSLVAGACAASPEAGASGWLSAAGRSCGASPEGGCACVLSACGAGNRSATCRPASQRKAANARIVSRIAANAATCPSQRTRPGTRAAVQRSSGATSSATKAEVAAGISTLAIARSAQPSRTVATSAMSQSCALRIVALSSRGQAPSRCSPSSMPRSSSALGGCRRCNSHGAARVPAAPARRHRGSGVLEPKPDGLNRAEVRTVTSARARAKA